MADNTDWGVYFDAELAEHRDVAARSASLRGDFVRLVALSQRVIAAGGKLLLFGNGGSAADAQHLATELTVRYRVNRRALAAIALTTDSSALTAIGNDFGFDQIFARQIEALGRAGDLAIAISTSGRSANVIEGLRAAKRAGLAAAALGGGDGGAMTGLADPLLLVPSRTTARIQEMHILLGQMLCGALEALAAGGAASRPGTGGQ